MKQRREGGGYDTKKGEEIPPYDPYFPSFGPKPTENSESPISGIGRSFQKEKLIDTIIGGIAHEPFSFKRQIDYELADRAVEFPILFTKDDSLGVHKPHILS